MFERLFGSDTNKSFISRLKTKTLLNASVVSSVHSDVVNIPLGLGYVTRNFIT